MLVYNLMNAQLNVSKLDSLFTLIEVKNKGMGHIFMTKDGKEIYQKSIGYADIENQIQSNRNTKYRIGSITKTFTATLIMQLIEEKKLNLSDHLNEFFPEIPNANKITIEHLLRHRSGIYNITDDKDFRTWMVVPNTKQQMLNRIAGKESQFKPGEKSEYSNSNYILLSYIIEAIENKTYAEVLSSKLIIPYTLKNTFYGSKINSKNNEANSYAQKATLEWSKQQETDMSVPVGAGAIVSTAEDVTIFYDHLFSGKILSKTSLSAMTTLIDNRGLGVVQFPFDGKKSYGHPGGIDGFQSIVVYIPEENLSVSYLSNGVVLSLNEILTGVLKVYFNIEYTLPDFKPAIKLKTEILDEYLGTYKGEEPPFEIEIIKDNITLIVKAKNGPTFPVESYEKDKFRSERAGVYIKFLTEKNKMFLQLGGKEIEFIKQ